ncbi:PREDICTED: uncharacterized protein LOC104600776 [Nelumbo nucifera]|uniref:Uncharacterized protein n=2 Tax=Nelumbo nucifera TaxID=4432 RepID=A0A822ZIL0_NELNU|nr:PREDICTED: uncharacterized protein LOC104600776 [Nelumbo nucifera]DAD44473.1 TPA_asm: hypothetical protein HUJ06_002703 [Nelumbo nucifera]
MLHRSFKAAKCKTSLKLAASRLKLLKNKRDAQVKQLKRELAKLIESGQEQTARIRVEHVVREEKTMAAYDLVEIYCELIAAQLAIIESQKNCPIDLKEAISSLIFASPRCTDVPELMEVRKHFTAKYGKEFVASSLELRPECGVNRTLVENLSARAPDGQMKIKILAAIAHEHNIDWDPSSLADKDSKPAEDFLNGPSTFEAASKLQVELPDVPTNPAKQESSMNVPNNNVTRSSPSSHVSATPYTTVPANLASESGTEGREFGQTFPKEGSFPFHKHNWNTEFKDATSAAQAAAESAERASIAARAAAELSRQYSSKSHGSPGCGFRDEGITSSTTQKLQDPVAIGSSKMVHDSSDSSSYVMNQGMSKQPRARNKQDNLPGVKESIYKDPAYVNRSNSSVSLESTTASAADHASVSSLSQGERYSEKRSSETEVVNPYWQARNPKDSLIHEASIKRQSSQSEIEPRNHLQQNKKTENINHYGEGTYQKKSSISVSSHSSVSTDDDDATSKLDVEKYKSYGGEQSFNDIDEGLQKGTKSSDYTDYPPAVFDDYGSDDDHHFEAKNNYNRHGYDFYFHSPVRKSPSFVSENTNNQSPRQKKNEALEGTAESPFVMKLKSPFGYSDRSTKSGVLSQSDDLLPVTYDNSDGPSSESEEEKDNFELHGRTESSSMLHNQNIFNGSPNSGQNNRTYVSTRSTVEKEENRVKRSSVIRSSSDLSESKEDHLENKQEIKFNNSREKCDQINFPTKQSPHRHTRSPRKLDNLDQEMPLSSSQLSLTKKTIPHDSCGSEQVLNITERLDISKFSNSESGLELNLGFLTGGLRNKGYRSPPYRKIPLGDASLLSQQHTAADTPSITNVSPVIRSSLNSEECCEGSNDQDSYSNDTKDLSQHQTDGRKSYRGSRLSQGIKDSLEQSEPCGEESNSQKMQIKDHKKSSIRTSKTYFDSNGADSKEVTLHQSVGSKSYAGSRLSRRTKGSPKQSEIGKVSRLTVGNQVPTNSEFGTGKKPSSQDSFAAEPLSRFESKTMSTDGEGSKFLRTNIPVEREPFKSMPEPKVSVHKEARGSYAAQPHSVSQSQVTSSESRDDCKPLRTSLPVEQKTYESLRESKFSERKDLSTSFANEPANKFLSQAASSESRSESKFPKDSSSIEQYSSKPIPESKFSVLKESRLDLRQASSAVEQPSNPQKTLPSGSGESSKISGSNEGSVSRENLPKASHVHPKLPDYETFAAHFHSLRSNKR